MNRGAMNITVVVAFLAALGVWLLLRPEGERGRAVPDTVSTAAGGPGQADTVEAALESLRGEVATLRREHDRLTGSLRATEAALNRSASLGVQAGALSDVEEGEGVQAEDSTRLSKEEKVAATLSELDLRLSKEAIDPTWSPRAEMDVAILLHPDTVKGSHVLSADCHSTLCRVEVEHENVSTQDRFTDYLPMEPPFDGEMLIQRIDDPIAPRTLIYLARQGYPLLVAMP